MTRAFLFSDSLSLSGKVEDDCSVFRQDPNGILGIFSFLHVTDNYSKIMKAYPWANRPCLVPVFPGHKFPDSVHKFPYSVNVETAFD